MKGTAWHLVEDALRIKQFADSEECSDRELEIRANKYKAKWNRDWFVVVDCYERILGEKKDDKSRKRSS